MVRARWRANPGFRPKLSDIIAQAPPAVARAGNAALRTNGEEAKTLIRTAAPKIKARSKSRSIGNSAIRRPEHSP